MYNSYHSSRSRSMETAALILSTISVIGCTCLYVSVPCGALAIILACLSTGGASSMSRKSMTAACIGLGGIVICIIFYAVSCYFMICRYGSLSNALDAYLSTYGMDYNSLLQTISQ